MHIIQKDIFMSSVKYSTIFGFSLLLSACNSTSQSLLHSNAPTTTASIKKNFVKKSMKKTVVSKELKKAIAYWGGKYKAKPNNAQYALNYAKNLKFAGLETTAVRTLVQSHRVNKGNKDIAGELGRLLLKRGDARRAEPLLMSALEQKKPDWKILSALGTVSAQKGKQDNARSYFSQALAIVPNKPSVLVNIATTYMLENKAAEAETFLRRAYTVKPTKATKRKLTQVLMAQGKTMNGSPLRHLADGAQKAGAKVTETAHKAAQSLAAPTTTASTIKTQNVKPLDISAKKPKITW